MKTERKAPFPIRVSDETMDWLQKKAKTSKRSVNYIVNRILESEVEKEKEMAA